MRRFLKITAWVLGVLILIIAGFVAHANYRISHDETQAYDAQAPGKYFTVQGHRLHIQTLGDVTASGGRPPLLLIHGFILSGHTEFLPWARDELAPRRALIMPDMLGMGFSKRIRKPGEQHTLASYARDLAGLLDQLGVQQVDIAGHSWGGLIAAQFAHDYPQRVRRLAIINGGFFFPPNSPGERVIFLPLGIGSAITWHTLAGGPKSFVALVCSGQPVCEGTPTAHIRDSTETLRAMIASSRQSTDIPTIEANLGRIETRALVLWGENDKLIPLTTGERLARELGNAQLVVVKNASHLPWRAAPRETAQSLLTFLDAP